MKVKLSLVLLVTHIQWNVSWGSNEHFRRISDGSCDTEDRSNDPEN